MNFLEICKAVRQEAGIQGVHSSVLNQTGIEKKIVDWVASSYEEIQTIRSDWAFLWKTASGTLTAGKHIYTPAELGAPDMRTLITDSIRLKYLDGATPRPLFVNWERAREVFGEGEGSPYKFTIRPDGAVQFSAKPSIDAPFFLEYYSKAHKMVVDNDQPVINEEFHWMIVYRALMKYAASEEAQFIYQEAELNYNRLLDRFEAIYHTRNSNKFEIPEPLA